eukprot:5871215-Prymnesium_polylepis.1
MSAGASRIRSRRNHHCRLSSFAFAGREHLAPCHVSNDARSIDRRTTSKTVCIGTRSSALISR